MKTTIKFFKESRHSDDYTYIFENRMVVPVVPNIGDEIFIQGQTYSVTYIKYVYEVEYCEIHIIVEEIDE